MKCSHCYLPVRRDGQEREINGETYQFCCYGCCLAFQVSHGQGEESEAAWLLVRLGVGTFLAMFIMLFSLLLYSNSFPPQDAQLVQIIHGLLWALATPVLIILGEPFIRTAWRAALEGRAIADTLVSIGALAAYGYSAWQIVAGGPEVYFDTVTMVLVLFTVGRYLEAAGRARTVRSLTPMLAAERATATVVAGAQDVEQAVQTIRPGTVVRVRPGERVSVDGIVLEGRSHCNEAMLSGQHEPQFKWPGSTVYAGCVNGTGQLLVRTTAAGTGTRWGQISRFVSAALDRKSIAGEIIDRAAAIFVPMVIVLSLVTMFYWHQGSLESGLLAALAVLVVACPCALGLAAPLATTLGLGQAAQHGILIRGGGVLERLAGIKAIAFDKTGTLTDGEMRLQRVFTLGLSEQDLLQRAAGLAQGSEHAVSAGIGQAARTIGVEPLPHDDIHVHPGAGVVGSHAGQTTVMGSAAFMSLLGWSIPEPLTRQAMTALHGATLVYVGWNGEVKGLLGLTDTLLPGARQVTATLSRSGLATCLLTGDNHAAAERIAQTAGIGTWRAALTPEEKVTALRDYRGQYGAIAMVGDGMNDGPVLAVANVGIAVGGATDMAQETAEVILPEGALNQLPWLLQLSRRVRRTIYTNIAWALGYNAIALSLAAGGLLLPVIAALLMAGSSLLVVFNSLHLGGAAESAPAAAQDAESTGIASA